MMPKTYGDKPLVFAFDGDGEQYMIGSEVGKYLRLFSGHLYKKFPGLARRNLTHDERRKLIDMGHSQLATSLKSYNISLLLAREVEDLLAGKDDQFKGNAGNGDTPKPGPPKVIKPPAAVAAMPNSSHLDAVPQPTPGIVMDASKAGPAFTRKRTASRRKGASIGKGGKQLGDGVAAASNSVSTMETRKKPRVDYTDAKWEKHLYLYNKETRDNEETDMAVEDSGRKIGGNNDNRAVEMKRKRGAINKQKKGMEKQGEVEAGKKGLEEGLVASANQKKEGGMKIKALRKQKGVNDEESRVSGKNKSQGKRIYPEELKREIAAKAEDIKNYAKVARIYSEELGFSVHPSTVRGIKEQVARWDAAKDNLGGKKSQQDGNQNVVQVEDLSEVKNKQEAEEDSEIIMTFNMLEFKETPLTEGCKKIRELEMKAKQLEMKEKLLDIERKETDRQLEAEKEKLKAALLDRGL